MGSAIASKSSEISSASVRSALFILTGLMAATCRLSATLSPMESSVIPDSNNSSAVVSGILLNSETLVPPTARPSDAFKLMLSWDALVAIVFANNADDSTTSRSSAIFRLARA